MPALERLSSRGEPIKIERETQRKKEKERETENNNTGRNVTSEKERASFKGQRMRKEAGRGGVKLLQSCPVIFFFQTRFSQQNRLG